MWSAPLPIHRPTEQMLITFPRHSQLSASFPLLQLLCLVLGRTNSPQLIFLPHFSCFWIVRPRQAIRLPYICIEVVIFQPCAHSWFHPRPITTLWGKPAASSSTACFSPMVFQAGHGVSAHRVLWINNLKVCTTAPLFPKKISHCGLEPQDYGIRVWGSDEVKRVESSWMSLYKAARESSGTLCESIGRTSHPGMRKWVLTRHSGDQGPCLYFHTLIVFGSQWCFVTAALTWFKTPSETANTALSVLWVRIWIHASDSWLQAARPLGIGSKLGRWKPTAGSSATTDPHSP